MAALYTVGYSTRTLTDLIEALQAHSIHTLVDVRSIPMSRRLPHFNRQSLEKSQPESGIRYIWSKVLGGRRKMPRQDSPNIALRNQSFRNYADYMLTGEFRMGATQLIALAQDSRTAYTCAERVYFRCHRMLISDWLVAHGNEVFHIDGNGSAKAHGLMTEARLIGGDLIYGATGCRRLCGGTGIFS